MKKFVIEFFDFNTGCVCNDYTVETSNLKDLSDIINDGEGEFHPSAKYDLTEHNLDQIEVLLNIKFERAGNMARLRSWRFTDELPYKVHTNKELALMLRNEKPLSVFCERFPSNPDFDLIPERFFAPHVDAGLFSTFQCIIADARGIENRFVFYATKGENWRIYAYILLKRTSILSGWSEGFERMEGSLLGYEDWQNDIYIEKVFKSRDGANSSVQSSATD